MVDGGTTIDLPVDLISVDLRMPNSQFYLITRYPNSSQWLGIEYLEADRR